MKSRTLHASASDAAGSASEEAATRALALAPQTPQSASSSPGTRPCAVEDFETIYRERCRLVGRFVRHFGVPEADVEDAIQEVFVVLYRRWLREDVPANGRVTRLREPTLITKSWLYLAARYVCLNRRRALRREGRRRSFAPVEFDFFPDERALDPFQQVALRQICRLLLDVIARNSLTQALILSRVEGRSLTEIGALVGVPAQTVASRLRLARLAIERSWLKCEALAL